MGDFGFSPDFSWAEADALLALRQPYPELLTFPGPRAWYCCETRRHEALFAKPERSAVSAQLKPTETLYHAHPVVRTHLLQGAAWIDPVDFDFDPEATIRFALAQDATAYWEQNRAWLQSEPVLATHALAVHERIGTILRQQINGMS